MVRQRARLRRDRTSRRRAAPRKTRPPALPRAQGIGWLHELRGRFIAHAGLKAIVIPLFVTAFFWAYFQLLRHPVFPVTTIPLSALDRLIGFHPVALLPYVSLWVYVFLVPAFLRGTRELVIYACEVMTLTLVGLGTFLLWPSAVPPLDFDATLHPMFAFLKSVDATGNACPSLHVAFAVFTLIWLARQLRDASAPIGLHLFNAGWCAAIVLSTVATKQHAVVDAIAGIALGGAAALFDPYDSAKSCHRAASLLNRQSLALLTSVMCKITVFALGLERHNPAMAAVLFFAPDVWVLSGLLLPNVSGLTPTATHFATNQREVWLTIDDGPDRSTTVAMLDLLERHAAKATFFLIGSHVAANPGLVGRIIRDGHTIGNHTDSHPLGTFWFAGPHRTATEIDRCQTSLRAAGAEPSGWFRSPAGIKTFFLRGALARRGLILIGWTTRARECLDSSIARPLGRLTAGLRPGAILLIHESARHGELRVALLSALLDHLKATGYKCVLPERATLLTQRTIPSPILASAPA
jgi:peptidoglycan/xylan/chitin deacetylase (PgdA/CDA1 family)